MSHLAHYNLGTVAKGSFIITLVEIRRLILTYIHNQLKGKENACARCMLKACICCLWCLKKCLTYLNQNAYTATEINSTSFCMSARDAFVILVENALRVATINTVGDFVLFLGKVLIVSCTAFVGVLSLNYQRDYTVWVLPLLIVCLFSWLEFVENSKKMVGRDRPEADGDGREMNPWNKSQLALTPILYSMLRLTHYHLGTVAKGSFIITLVAILRFILTYIHNQLKGNVHVGEDEVRDLHQGDDEGAFGHSAQVVAGKMQHR
ncbi:unnamed protein product [Coregonus sp. 'balchen']|nr:unnamed protein product [Coregonus sp. 'balchen']